MTTRLETASRPWEYSAHLYIDEKELVDWDVVRVEELRLGLALIRDAIARDEPPARRSFVASD